MKEDPFYEKLQNRLGEISAVPPQTLGPLTSIYKKTTAWIKTWPVKVLIPLAFVGGILFQVLLGEKIVKAVSLLQWGF